MNIELVKVEEEQREILAHLLELYQYDFSEYDNEDVNSYGLYGYSYLDYYWTEQNRYAYFIKVDGKYAATKVLSMHPGKWELTVHPNNRGAHVFWYSVISDICKGRMQVVEKVPGVYDEGLATAYLFTV